MNSHIRLPLSHLRSFSLLLYLIFFEISHARTHAARAHTTLISLFLLFTALSVLPPRHADAAILHCNIAACQLKFEVWQPCVRVLCACVCVRVNECSYDMCHAQQMWKEAEESATQSLDINKTYLKGGEERERNE